MNILKAEMLRMLIMLRRYPLATISIIIAFYLLFGGILLVPSIFFGNGGISGEQKTVGLVSFLMWFYALMALGTLSENIREEAQTGTLEQIYLHIKNPMLLYTYKLYLAFILQTMMIAVIILLCKITYGVNLPHISVATIIVLFLSLSGLYGFGLILGGCTLIFKKIGELVNIMRFIFLVFTLVKWETFSFPWREIGGLLPLVEGTIILRKLSILKSDLISIEEWIILIVQASVYIILGIIFFKVCEKIARQKALLSHY